MSPDHTLSFLSVWGLTLVGPESVSPLRQVIALNFYAWNWRVLWTWYWLWANTNLLVKQGRVMFLEPKIKHFLPAVTPVSIEECNCIKSCCHLPSAVTQNKLSSVHSSQLPLKCILGWLNLMQTNSWLGDHFLTWCLIFMCYSPVCCIVCSGSIFVLF